MVAEDTRDEVIVFITPYVLDTPEEIAADARRRKDATATKGMWKRGWSESNTVTVADSNTASAFHVERLSCMKAPPS